MAAIWYTGLANVRSISTAEWAAAGVPTVATTIWEKSNGWSLPKAAFSQLQLDILAADPDFNINGADGPRPSTFAVSDPDEPATREWVAEMAGLVEEGAIPDEMRGVAFGVATLGSNGKITEAQLPTRLRQDVLNATYQTTYEPGGMYGYQAEKGVLNGIAPLNASGFVPDVHFPDRLQAAGIAAAIAAGVGPASAMATDTVRRPLIGARVGSGSGVTVPDNEYFNELHALEFAMKADADVTNWYRGIGTTSAADFTATVVPELVANPNRKVVYVFEMDRSNAQFNRDFDAQDGIYPHLLATLIAIKNSGFMDRVFLAPFHEGNGGGGDPGDIGSYDWHMYDTDLGQLFTPDPGNWKTGTPYGATFRLNTPEQYKTAFRNFVDLARELGLTSKIVQWFLAANTSDATLVDGIERTDMAPGYAGDDYVDIIGLSYYNRSGDLRYSDTWPQPGANGLREFYNAVERMTANPIWICETGCAQSNAFGDKGQWYADLIRLVASNELPRIEAMIMFMQDSRKYDEFGAVTQGMNMKLETTAQKARVGMAINAAKRPVKIQAIPSSGRNLYPLSVAALTTLDAWLFTAGVTCSIGNQYTPNLDPGINGMRVNKPAYTAGDTRTSYTLYRRMAKASMGYVPNDPHVTTIRMRASYSGFRVELGMRQDGGFANTLGDELVLSDVWEDYVVPFSSQTDDPTHTHWRALNFCFGNNQNVSAAWFEFAEPVLARGSLPIPNTEKNQIPRAQALTPATDVTWNCEAADLFTLLLDRNITLLEPLGVPFNGQEISLRVTQDATGGRSINLHASFYDGDIDPTIATGPGTKTLLTFQYDADDDKWGLIKTGVIAGGGGAAPIAPRGVDQYDYVAALAARSKGIRLQMKKVNSTNEVEISALSSSGKHVTYQFYGSTAGDDYRVLANVWTGTSTASMAQASYKSYANLSVTGTFSAAAAAFAYTTDVATPAKFTVPITIDIAGSDIRFHTYRDNRGGIWELKLSGPVSATVTASTWNATAVYTYSTFTTVAANLPPGEYTVVGTFMGDDPLNVPSGGAGTARGWLANNSVPAAATGNAILFDVFSPFRAISKDVLLKPASNMDIAMQVKPAGGPTYEWLPYHGVATAFTADAPVFLDGDAVIDMTTLFSGSFKSLSGFELVQRVYGRNTSSGATNLVELATSHVIRPSGQVTVNGRWLALADIVLGDNYVVMFPGAMAVFDQLATSIGNKYANNTGLIGTETALVAENDAAAGYLFLSSTNKAVAAAARYTNIMETLRRGKGNKNTSATMAFLQHRDSSIVKVYNRPFAPGTAVPTGTVHRFSGDYIYAQGPGLYDQFSL